MANSFTHLTNGYIRNDNVKLKLAVLGAPGSGKSTLSSGLLYFSKMFLFKVDSVPEVAKWHVYKGTDFNNTDFEYTKFKEQKELEDIYPEKLEITICEAPLIISSIYAAFYYGADSKVTKDMLDLAEQYKNRYTHFFVSRKLIKFEAFGRNENEEQANKIHDITVNVLERLQLNYTVINRYDDHIPLQVLAMIGAIRKEDPKELNRALYSVKEPLLHGQA